MNEPLELNNISLENSFSSILKYRKTQLITLKIAKRSERVQTAKAKRKLFEGFKLKNYT